MALKEDQSATANMAQTNSNTSTAIGTTDYIEESKISAAQQMMSSCAGACLVSLFMTPLDVVKIRLQAQELVFQQKCFLYSNGLMDHLCQRLNGDPPPVALHTREEICNCKWYNRPKYFDGTMDAMIKIGRTEGMASLWSGLSPTLVLAIPATVVYFTSYEQLRDALHRNPQYSDLFPQFERSSVISMTAGSAARTFATTLVSPLEMVRTKMQSKKMAFSQVREALAMTLRHEGILGLWKGCGPTLLRDVPFSAMYWPVYEFLRGNFLGTDLKAREKMPQAEVVTGTFVAGALAGSLAATATLPFDVIKTRRQIELGETELFTNGANQSKSKQLGHSTLATARTIVQGQGVRGLFVGLTPRILKIAPACAIMISSYEFFKRFFRKWNESHAQNSTKD